MIEKEKKEKYPLLILKENGEFCIEIQEGIFADFKAYAEEEPINHMINYINTHFLKGIDNIIFE